MNVDPPVTTATYDGADLNYAGEDLTAYQAIWDNAKTKTTEADHRRVVEALKDIFEEQDWGARLDLDNLARYMAVNIFCVNDDSLWGFMPHNYYLYEKDGQLNLLPWDYNLAFGGSGRQTATEMVNTPIDDPWYSTDLMDLLLADEHFRSAVHGELARIVDFVENGAFDDFYAGTRSLIDEAVRQDPTSFYDWETYDRAAEAFRELARLRAASVRAQLNGEIPALNEERTKRDALIDASAIELKDLGYLSFP